MSLTKDEIRDAALRLDPAEREALAEELLLSINDSEQAAIDAAWLAQAKRRDAEYEAGLTAAHPVDEVLARLRSKARQP